VIMKARLSLVLIGLLGLGGCMSSRLGPAPTPTPASTTTQFAVPTVEINAPSLKVRQTIIARAKARATNVASVEPGGIVLERTMSATPAALESVCGPHREGRKIRVLLGTADQGATTLVSEQRFIVDGESECRIPLTPDVVEDAKRSLNELKTDSETAVARR